MESITINNQEKHYEIESINPESAHIMKIVFADAVPDHYGDIQVYTSGGSQCSNLPGYETVFRDEGQTVYLSDDGSVYMSPEDPAEVPTAPYIPTPGELLASAKAGKRAEVSAACEQIIYNGVNVTLEDGTVEHYSLTEHDQLNLFGITWMKTAPGSDVGQTGAGETEGPGRTGERPFRQVECKVEVKQLLLSY